jgi:hypothetical protein
LASDRSAPGSTTVCTLASLLALTGSETLDATLALFVIVPAVGGVTVIVEVALAPLASVPREHVTVPDCSEQLPWDALAEPKVTPAGSVSVRVTALALEGPSLVAVSV